MARYVMSRVAPARRRAGSLADQDYGATATPDWRSIDWQQQLRSIELDGRRVNYVDVGEGEREPLVFIHGLAGRWTNWLENVPCFAEERRVIALDLPGFGHSEMPAEAITINGYGRCIDELCERLALGRVVACGNSMGGFTAAELAISNPDRVAGLVLVSAVGISVVHLRREPLLALAKLAAAALTASAAQQPGVLRRPAWRHAALSLVYRHPTRMPQDLLSEQLQGAGTPGFLQALDALTSYDFTERLPEISCPTLIVWGEEDSLVPVADADEFERLVPDARKLVLADTGHCAMTERPRAFNTAVREFLLEVAQPLEKALLDG